MRCGHWSSLGLLLLGCAQPPPMPVMVGTGQFELAETADGGTYPVALAAGDFDGDGVPTLVVDAIPPFTSELLGGALRAGAWPLPSRTSPMAVADLDGDGKPELIAGADEAFGRSEERGGFFRKFSWSVRSTPVGLTVGALTPSDGPELVVSSEQVDANGDRIARLSIFEQRTEPRYVSVASFDVPACETPAIVDFDNDGFGEVVCPSYFTSRVTVLERRSNDFSQPVSLAAPGVPDRATACDLDGDGRQEALITVRSQGASLLRRVSAGAFEFVPLLQGFGFCGDVHCADLDADGDQEVVAICDSELLVLQIAAGQASASASFPVPMAHRMLYADMTGDGVGDLVVTTLEEHATLRVFRALTVPR